MAQTDTRTHITDVHTIAVPVSDQERALDFYVRALGFEKRLDAAFGPGQRWIEVGPAGSNATIALPPAPPGTAFGIDTGIRLESDDVEADHRSLGDRGVDVGEVLRFGPGVPPMFTFRDADGNLLYVVGRM